MMFFYLFFIFTIVPFCEIYLLITVGGWVGFWNTLFLVLLTGILGAYLVQSEWRNLLPDLFKKVRGGNQNLTESFLDSVCVFTGSVLLITPGFITDIIGLTLVFSLTRRVYAMWFSSLLKKGFVKTQRGFFYQSGAHSRNQNSDEVKNVTPQKEK